MDYLLRDQVEALMQYANPKEQLILALAFFHGLRVSEVMRLQMRDVEAGILRIHSLKGSKNAKHDLMHFDGVSIPAMLAAYLKIRGPGAPDEPLFPAKRSVTTKSAYSHRNTAGRMIKRLAALAGIPDAHMHMLRHGTAVTMVQAGEHIDVIQRWMRHRSLNSTGSYFHCDDKEAREGAARAFTCRARGD